MTEIVIPRDKNELLKLISGNQEGKATQGAVGSSSSGSDAAYLSKLRHENKRLRADMLREKVEREMMELEDYTFKPEGKIRLQRYKEEVQMSEEDELSRQLAEWYREQEQLAFQSNVRKQAEVRAQEEARERERKKQEALARRAAVLERIRKAQEEEERIRREAEEKARAILEAEERERLRLEQVLAEDRRVMSVEDELSLMAEQVFREELAEKARLQAEADRMAAWEEKERLRAEAEEATRSERMAALQAKKAKLREMQARAKAAGSTSDIEAKRAALQQDSLRQAKQMRIQNKAQYINRRIKAGTAPGQAVPPSPAPRPSPMKRSFSHLAEASEGALGAAEAKNLKTSTVPQAFLDEIAAITSEADLKEVMQSLMGAKRKLRLEQRQLLNEGSSAEQESRMIEIKNQVLEVTQKEKAVKDRTKAVKKLLKSKPGVTTALELHDTETTANTGEPVTIAAAAATTAASAPSPAPTVPHSSTLSPSTASIATDGPTSPDKPSDEASAATRLFSQSEALLREGSELVAWLSRGGDGDSADDAMRTQRMRRCGVLGIEMHEVAKKLAKGADDVLGYGAKLGSATTALQAAVEASKQRYAAGVSLSSRTPAPVPEPTVQPTSEPTVTEIQPTPQQEQKPTIPIPTPISTPTPAPASTHADAGAEVASSSTQLEAKGGATGAFLTPPQSPRAPETADEKERDAAAAASMEDSGTPTLDFASLPGWNECLNTSMTTAAHHAAFYGFVGVLEFLSLNFDVFTMDEEGRTPLYYAAMQNHLDCVVCLASLDAQWLDVGDSSGNTPLHASVMSGSSTTEVLNFLLSCEANPDTANHVGATPCHLARSAAALEALYNWGATPYCVDTQGRMPLWHACERGAPRETSYLCSVTPSEYLLYGDEEGSTPLHVSASKGTAECVEVLCQWMQGADDLYVANKKGQHAAHVAKNAAVLQTLYENGADLWVPCPKGRCPLFMASFQGYVDAVAFLLEVGMGRKLDMITVGDFQGDTALHAAALCGRLQCVELLSFFMQDSANHHGLSAQDLAHKAGHTQVYSFLGHLESMRLKHPEVTPEVILGCGSFGNLSAIVSYYGSRWSKLYDADSDACYYLDRATGHSQWERPALFDVEELVEKAQDTARDCLRNFYIRFNKAKLASMNDILQIYRGKYTELFIELANRYQLDDLSIFQGVYIDD